MADLTCSKNLPPEFVTEIKSLSIDTIPYNTLFIDQKPILTENYTTLAPDHADRSGFRSLASIPLISKGLAIGGNQSCQYTTIYFF